MATNCDLCPLPATTKATAKDGTIYRACTHHSAHIRAWVAQHNYERRCERAEDLAIAEAE